ncbi:MAG: prolyl oligopeptidase family serine peptidase [Thauera phenolivorans]|uniref:Prolyl oligopeptidase family serine peptidase n=1 Tax=Thauera phenolivorans TaxID=1792543 RepID=A0A7X7LUM9_9RHOO|nr:PHB depolymerase family esterase [Thauera phenolivorans]NLF53512.1 prolyl oligopeptidase family serine peptidase [Thauera phenolivorans]
MSRRKSPLGAAFQRAMRSMTRATVRAGSKAVNKAMNDAVKAAVAQTTPPPGAGDWIAGQAVGPGGLRRWFLFRPQGVSNTERLPLLVMLHGCGQTARSFALSTRMNRIAARERFLVLYPEQDRMVNPQGCWDWYGTGSGKAHAEAGTLMAAIDQICLLYPVEREAVALAGISAGASMAALLAAEHPERFRALVMHSGVAPGAARSSASALSAMRGRREPGLARIGVHPLPPLLVIHGSRDLVVAPSNGEAAVHLWAAACAGRAGEPRRVQRGQRHATMVTDFRAGGRVVASLHEVEGLGHAWSGGDGRQHFSDPEGPDASRLAWAFFARQLRARAGRRGTN